MVLAVSALHSLALGALFAAAVAGTGSGSRLELNGVVLDATSGDPIPGAQLSLARARVEMRSGQDGRFSFEAYDLQPDTLTIAHPDYHTARILLGNHARESLDLRVILRQRHPTYGTTGSGIQDEAAIMLQLTGGVLWSRADFWPYLQTTSHPLDLLLFSGLVHRITETSEGDPCVELAPGADCAVVTVHGADARRVDLGSRFPTEVAAFIVVPPTPGPGAQGAQPIDESSAGQVVVFLVEGSG